MANESMDTTVPKCLRVRDVAERLSMSQRQVYRLMDTGVLPYIQIPSSEPDSTKKTRRVEERALEALLKAHSVPARQGA